MITRKQLFWVLVSTSLGYLLCKDSFKALSSSFLLSCLFLGYNILLYPRISPIRHIPTAPQRPLWKRFFKEPTPWAFERWVHDVPNDGVIRYFGVFNVEKLLLTTPQAHRDILQNNPYDFGKQEAQNVHLEPVLGRGLVFVEGNEHKVQRKNLAPVFRLTSVREYQPIIWEKTMLLMGLFSKAIQDQSEFSVQTFGRQERASGVVEIHDPVSRTALDIIGDAGCGIHFESLTKRLSRNSLVSDYRRIFGASPASKVRCYMALMVPGWVVNHAPIQRNREVSHAIRKVVNIAQRVIHSKSEGTECDKNEKCPPHGDIIDKIMSTGKFTENDLISQTKTLLAAGHDTTSSTIASAAWILSQPENYHIQERLREEIRSKIPGLSEDDLPTAVTLENMAYLRAVRTEILRLFPPISWYFRRSIKPTTICDYQIPANVDIIVCPWILHRSKSVWGPDAEEFRPDRWVDDPHAGGAKDKYCYNTFSNGLRSCVGEQFAKNEISTIMAALFGRFELRSVENEPKPVMSHQLVFTYKGGIKVNMTRIDNW